MIGWASSLELSFLEGLTLIPSIKGEFCSLPADPPVDGDGIDLSDPQLQNITPNRTIYTGNILRPAVIDSRYKIYDR